MDGGAQDLKQNQSFEILSGSGKWAAGPGIRTKPNFRKNEKFWEVGSGAQELEQNQSFEILSRSGKWAAGPRSLKKTKV